MGQNDEFQTDINCHKIFTACVATGDQPTVHKESQPVPGLKLKSYNTGDPILNCPSMRDLII